MWFCFLNVTPLPSAFNLIFVGAKIVKNKAFRLHQTQIYQQQQKAGQVQSGRSLPLTISNGCCKLQFYTVQFVIFYAPQKAALIRWDNYHTHLELLLKGILGLGLSCTHKKRCNQKVFIWNPQLCFFLRSPICLQPNMGLIDCSKVWKLVEHKVGCVLNAVHLPGPTVV